MPLALQNRRWCRQSRSLSSRWQHRYHLSWQHLWHDAPCPRRCAVPWFLFFPSCHCGGRWWCSVRPSGCHDAHVPRRCAPCRWSSPGWWWAFVECPLIVLVQELCRESRPTNTWCRWWVSCSQVPSILVWQSRTQRESPAALLWRWARTSGRTPFRTPPRGGSWVYRLCWPQQQASTQSQVLFVKRTVSEALVPQKHPPRECSHRPCSAHAPLHPRNRSVPECQLR